VGERLAGWLLFVFNDGADRLNLSASLSPDDGRTWTPPRAIIENDGQHAYPAVAQTPDGLIHVLYTHDRRYIGHATFNEAWAANSAP
jgi:predicted neuraminidase